MYILLSMDCIIVLHSVGDGVAPHLVGYLQLRSYIYSHMLIARFEMNQSALLF